MKIIFSLLISLTAASYLYAQESDTLTTRYKVLSKGNIFITGNNILNRKEGKADANTPYNDLIGGLKLNDFVKIFSQIFSPSMDLRTFVRTFHIECWM